MEAYDIKKLSEIKNLQSCMIVKVNGHGGFRHRIKEMGFVKGRIVTVVKNAPLRDPIEYDLGGSHISLRRSEADLIDVIEVTINDTSAKDDDYNGILMGEEVSQIFKDQIHNIKVALVGNPNSGKTSLFNRITGLHEKVGNYSGVTVDAKTSTIHYKNYKIEFVDLPGTYSITEYTPEEIFVRKYLTEKHPDLILNVVDASNLERNLFLTTQLIDMNMKVVISLNMYDELTKEGASLNYEQLGELLGIPFVPTIASKGEGVDELLNTLVEVFEDKAHMSRHIHINYGTNIENAIQAIKDEIVKNKSLTDIYHARYLAIKMLENDDLIKDILSSVANYKDILEVSKKQIQVIEKEYKDDTRSVITDAKYGFIRGALQETYVEGKRDKHWLSNRIDDILTHPVFGFPVLLLFLWIMFQATFSLGQFPMDWIESGIGALNSYLSGTIPPGWFNDLLTGGIISGVGGVLVFLPNILILFFFISFMEDSGYMARTAFIMDKLMHKIGLHGKSFIPMLIGFGCNVPAIMATRTLESRKDRLLTMLIIPFMSCSARLPVYVLMISAFFPSRQGLILLSIYIIGVIIAILFAMVMNKLVFTKETVPFVMELPPYRMPTMRNTLIHMWDKSVQYLKKMGGIILFASIVIWVLGYFPRETKQTASFESAKELVLANPDMNDSLREMTYHELELAQQADQLSNAYIGRLGHFIEPVIEPLGFDWKMGVGLITGFAAKELVVSTMGVLYQTDEEDEGGLVTKIQNQSYTEGPKIGQKVFTPLVAYGFMLFILIYVPCMAVVAAIRKEGGWKWALLVMLYTTGIAWVVSFLVYQIGMLF